MHKTVLLDELLDLGRAEKGSRFIDGTIGDGGLAFAILDKNPSAEVLGIDLDQTSLDKLEKKIVQRNLGQKIRLAHGNFAQIGQIAKANGFGQASAVFLDLGFSSTQLSDPSRGLSFQTDANLDMRFDQNLPTSAYDVVNTYKEEKLAKIFRDYGEEKLASRIAHRIVRVRTNAKIATTLELFEIIKSALPKPVAHKSADFARRIFQAIRIEVNHELDNLKEALPQITGLLEKGGRALIISFQSLEDRLVKQFFVSSAKGCVCPPDFPTCVCGKNPVLRIITKKPVLASESEIAENPRSKPAKLRVAEKV